MHTWDYQKGMFTLSKHWAHSSGRCVNKPLYYSASARETFDYAREVTKAAICGEH